MARAWVSGGHGFVGPWLRRHLEECGDEVTAPEQLEINDAASVAEAIDSAEPDVVYHLAALSSVAASWDAPAETFAVNTVGTVHLLSAVRRAAPRARVVVVSSVEVYGMVAEADLPVAESAPLRPATPYAASKAGAEMAAIQAHLGWGLDVIRARPFTHTGPGQSDRFFVPSMARQIVEGPARGDHRLLTGNLEVRRDILDVRDVVRAYRLLAERGNPGAVYNVCSGTSRPLSEVLARMLELADSRLEVQTDPARLRPVDLPDLRGDPHALATDTGWRPEFNLDETLGGVLDYWSSEVTSPGSPTTC